MDLLSLMACPGGVLVAVKMLPIAEPVTITTAADRQLRWPRTVCCSTRPSSPLPSLNPLLLVGRLSSKRCSQVAPFDQTDSDDQHRYAEIRWSTPHARENAFRLMRRRGLR